LREAINIKDHKVVRNIFECYSGTSIESRLDVNEKHEFEGLLSFLWSDKFMMVKLLWFAKKVVTEGMIASSSL
jgi:hypothetical protein